MAETGPDSGLLVHVARTDGLCMRLNGILDAMLMAEVLGGDIRFGWPAHDMPAVDQQTADDPARVFAPAYLARYRIPMEAVRVDLQRHGKRITTAEMWAALVAEVTARGGMFVDRPRDMVHLYPFLAERFDGAGYARAFARIGFAPEVQDGIDRARGVALPEGTVAVHVRGGDIVHGTHSHHACYTHKAPSVFELGVLVDELVAVGAPVCLIGQEPDLQAVIRAGHRGVLDIDLDRAAEGLGPVARVIFDAVVLSRMAAVHGGNSGVSLLGCRIGGVPFHDIARRDFALDPGDFLDDPLAGPEFAGLSAAQKAHAYYKLIFMDDPGLWSPRHRAVVAMMRRWRPDSRYYALLAGLMDFAAGGADRDRGEAGIAAFLAGPEPDEDPVLYACLRELQYFPVIETAVLMGADPGTHPAAARLFALREALVAADGAALDAALEGAHPVIASALCHAMAKLVT